MSLPTPGDQSARTQSQRPHSTPATHTQPVSPSAPLSAPRHSTPVTQTPLPPTTGGAHKIVQKGVTGTTAHSWDWAPGGLKTFTAKRELPPRLVQRPVEQQPNVATVPRSYTFALVILACIVVMLVSGGVVFFLMLQP